MATALKEKSKIVIKYSSFIPFRVPANDDPHGVFSLDSQQQAVVVAGSGSLITRALVVNVTRLAGLFGNASVGYKISGRGTELMNIQEMLGGQAEGRLLMVEGQPFRQITVPISSQVRIMLLFDNTKKLCIWQSNTLFTK